MGSDLHVYGILIQDDVFMDPSYFYYLFCVNFVEFMYDFWIWLFLGFHDLDALNWTDYWLWIIFGGQRVI